jgi:hypothetical protein
VTTAITLAAEHAELRGPPDALAGVLEQGTLPPELDGTTLPPLLAAGLAAAREPVARLRLTGLGPPVLGVADARTAALLAPTAPGRAVLRGCTPSGWLGLLVRATALGPRPRHDGDPVVRLPAADLAALLAGRDALGAGLASADAQRLQDHLTAAERHWRIELVRVDGRPGDGHAAGWYLEVLDGPHGLWTIEAQDDATVALLPSDPTRVLDAIAELPARVGLGRT